MTNKYFLFARQLLISNIDIPFNCFCTAFFRDLVGNGSTGPQGVYDQPRPQFYDVPKSMHSPSPFRSSTSSLGSNMEVKNPVYLEKKK